jgi:hypothetical protein
MWIYNMNSIREQTVKMHIDSTKCFMRISKKSWASMLAAEKTKDWVNNWIVILILYTVFLHFSTEMYF